MKKQVWTPFEREVFAALVAAGTATGNGIVAAGRTRSRIASNIRAVLRTLVNSGYAIELPRVGKLETAWTAVAGARLPDEPAESYPTARDVSIARARRRTRPGTVPVALVERFSTLSGLVDEQIRNPLSMKIPRQGTRPPTTRGDGVDSK